MSDRPALPCRFALAFGLWLGLAVLPAAAQEERLVAPDAFEALAEGRTLHFSLDGVPFGSERFYPGRRSLWRFAGDGSCAEGVWHARGEEICFVYPGPKVGPICWRFLREGEGYAARLVEGGAETGFRLVLEAMDDARLACPGPEVGS